MTGKLSRGQCEEIRRLHAEGLKQARIASEFDVSQATVSKVVAGWSPVEQVATVKSICSVEEPLTGPCGRPARSRYRGQGPYCTMHLQRVQAHGDPLVVVVPQKTVRICTVDDCPNERGSSALYCELHRSRVRRQGDPNIALKDHTPAIERWRGNFCIQQASEWVDTPCWLWNGPFDRDKNGKPTYGLLSDGKDNRHMAHRFVFAQEGGVLIDGLVLDHLCKVKACVNPEHMDQVTQAVNAYRGGTDGGNAAKTACDYGHKFTPENTYYRDNGWRSCRVCNRRRMRVGKYRAAYGSYLYLPGYPIADKAGRVAPSRVVLYEAIGPGPHLCHWGCGRVLCWGGIHGVQADHINGEPMDNRPENLVPSCQSCNKSRAAAGNPADWQPKRRCVDVR